MTREQRTLEAMRRNPMKYVRQFLPKPWYHRKFWQDVLKEVVGVTIAIVISHQLILWIWGG